jgi:hypothetical protein
MHVQNDTMETNFDLIPPPRELLQAVSPISARPKEI